MKLKTQIAITFVPLLILSGGGMTYLGRKAVHKIILEEAANRGQAKLEEAALLTASGFGTGREDLLLPILTSALSKEGAIYVMALDAEGKVLAHTNVLEKGKKYTDRASREIIQANTPTYHEISGGPGDPTLLDLACPVWSHEDSSSKSSEELMLLGSQSHEKKRIGTLRMGMSLERARATERKILGQLIILLLLTDCLLLGLALVLIRSLLRPVDLLVKATEEIGLGVYGATIPIPSASELGGLAKSFNRMTQALAQTTVSKDFLDDILKNMLEPLIVLEPDARIRMVNRAALEMLGYGPQELLDQPIQLVWEDTGGLLAVIVQKGSVKDRELQLKSKAGTLVSVLFSGSAFTDKDGRLLGLTIVAKDIRERKKLEAEMLQSEKLSAVGRLASGVAHEINNPLGVILGFVEGILWDVKPEDPLSGPLKSIERETIRCKNLVEDLLTFSRVSKTDREPLDLNKAVEGALSLITAQARLRKIHVEQDLARDLPSILGNLNQVQQVVVNLANNAMDAMNDEGTVTVKTERISEAGVLSVVLHVIDTGSGIPPEILPRIFEPFFTTKPIGKGTGLGLGLVHEIVQKHDGTIEVESRPGRTEFRVKFPV